MFGWEYPPFRAGGLATATQGLVKGLLRRGLEVALVVPFPVEGPDLQGFKLVSATRRMQRLKVRRVQSPLAPYLTAHQYDQWVERWAQGTAPRAIYGRHLFEEVERFAAIAAELAAQEPHDLINAHDWMTYLAGVRARQASGRPLVAHIHATEFDRSGDFPNHDILRREREGLQAADLVIANSHRLKRQLVERYQLAHAKIAVVHWGIDEAWAAHDRPPQALFDPREPVVLFLGRVTRQKGPDYFVEMAAKVVRFVPSARFIVAGGGDLLGHIVQRAVELGLAQRVHFTGPLEESEVKTVLRLADVCVMPSVSEPFGLVALESLKSGTPCLVSREAGVAEVLQNVMKVDFWDVDEMTNKVVSLLRHAALGAELRARGLQETSAPRLGLDEPARHTEAVFRRALQTAGERISP